MPLLHHNLVPRVLSCPSPLRSEKRGWLRHKPCVITIFSQCNNKAVYQSDQLKNKYPVCFFDLGVINCSNRLTVVQPSYRESDELPASCRMSFSRPSVIHLTRTKKEKMRKKWRGDKEGEVLSLSLPTPTLSLFPLVHFSLGRHVPLNARNRP